LKLWRIFFLAWKALPVKMTSVVCTSVRWTSPRMGFYKGRSPRCLLCPFFFFSGDCAFPQAASLPGDSVFPSLKMPKSVFFFSRSGAHVFCSCLFLPGDGDHSHAWTRPVTVDVMPGLSSDRDFSLMALFSLSIRFSRLPFFHMAECFTEEYMDPRGAKVFFRSCGWLSL